MKVLPEDKFDEELLYLKKKIWVLEKQLKEAHHKIERAETQTTEVILNRHETFME